MKLFCKNSKNAFTLVELLVVISILALLVSILMPALNKAKQSARRVVCASNFRQIGNINHLYANDFGQWLPRMVAEAYKDKTIGEEIKAVIPCEISATCFEHLRDGYGTEEKFWICPSLKLRDKEGMHTMMLDADGKFFRLRKAGYMDERYRVGILNLVGLVAMRGPEPVSADGLCYVKDSACKITDSSEKILAADWTLKWRFWQYPQTIIAHPGKTDLGITLPDGANRVHVDGSVTWNRADKMGYHMLEHREAALVHQEQVNPGATPVQGKYDHWPGGNRDYFW